MGRRPGERRRHLLPHREAGLVRVSAPRRRRRGDQSHDVLFRGRRRRRRGARRELEVRHRAGREPGVRDRRAFFRVHRHVTARPARQAHR